MKKTKYDEGGEEARWREQMVHRARKEIEECQLDIKFAINKNAQFGNWIVAVPMAALSHIQSWEEWDKVDKVRELPPDATDWIQKVDPEAYKEFLEKIK